MAASAQLTDVFSGSAPGPVPGAQIVPDLRAALDLVRRLGGAIASEIRTAPGIGS